MRILKTTIVFLRTQQAVLLLLILALLAQLPHTATVFHRISTTQSETLFFGMELGAFYGWTLAYVAAISVELAVLMFVVRGRKWYSWGFAACSVLMNMFYYWKPTWSLWVFPYPIDLLAALLWSLILPVAIALYSHEIKHERDAEEEQTQTTITEEQVLPSFLPLVLQEVQTQGNNGFTPFTNGALDTIAAALTPNDTPAKQRNQPSKTKASIPTAKSSRPQQVANLKQAGKSNAEIARLLSITESTVRVNWKQYNDSQKEQANGSSSNNNGTGNNGFNPIGTSNASQKQTGGAAYSGAGETHWSATDAEGSASPTDQPGFEAGTYSLAT
jgi:DNA-binding transcriptional regulator YiaG